MASGEETGGFQLHVCSVSSRTGGNPSTLSFPNILKGWKIYKSFCSFHPPRVRGYTRTKLQFNNVRNDKGTARPFEYHVALGTSRHKPYSSIFCPPLFPVFFSSPYLVRPVQLQQCSICVFRPHCNAGDACTGKSLGLSTQSLNLIPLPLSSSLLRSILTVHRSSSRSTCLPNT